MTSNSASVAALIEQIVNNGKVFQQSNNEAAKLQIVEAASKLITELENPMEQLARICWGEPSRFAALQTAFELGILTKLKPDTPLSSVQLAEGTTADPILLARILKNLAAYNIIKEVDRDQYLATPLTMASASPAVNGCMVYSFDVLQPTWTTMAEYLAKNKYQNPTDADNSPMHHGLKTDKNFFAYLQSSATVGPAFNNFMTGHARNRPAWVTSYPCAERLIAPPSSNDNDNKILIVDVGGGLGHCLSDFQAQFPDAKGKLILQDQPHIIKQVEEASSSSNNLSAQIKPVVHDFLQPQPAEYHGARAYFMRQIMHDWSDETCIKILSNLRSALTPGYSKILINEHVVSDVGAVWQQTSLDMTMMAVLSSNERTEQQWRTMLGKAGLKITGIFQKDTTSEAVIEAVLADE